MRNRLRTRGATLWALAIEEYTKTTVRERDLEPEEDAQWKVRSFQGATNQLLAGYHPEMRIDYFCSRRCSLFRGLPAVSLGPATDVSTT